MKLRTGATVRVEVSKKKTWMSHFETDFVGILGRNYHQKFRHGSEREWSVHHPEYGWISWYDSDDLTVIKAATDKSELEARRLEDRG